MRIFFLISILSLLSISVMKGCSGYYEIPKQIPGKQDSLNPFVYQYPFVEDSILKVAVGKQYQKGAIHTFFFGKHYRSVWATPVRIKVFNISKMKGGLKVIKRGGSMQTQNLRLENIVDGKRYVLRTVDKDQSKALPPFLRRTFVKSIFVDQTSALNPYASLIVAPLAEAAGMYHTNPQLFFITYDTAFKEYAHDLEGRVALFEEFPDESWAHDSIFGNPDEIVSTAEFLKEKFNKQNVKANALLYARCRLFDMLINDWDRHSDQWRWTKIKTGDSIFFSPIPRDRDMAFYKYNDGILTAISTQINPKLQTFDEEFKSIEGLKKNARYLDHLLLSHLTEAQLTGIADSIKIRLTDKIIDASVKGLPEEIYEKEGRQIAFKLKTRRDRLRKAAKDFYRINNQEVYIVGTDEVEKIEVKRLNNNETSVTVFQAGKLIPLYQRTFNNKITEQISIYSLDGNDEIEVSGKVDKGIKILIFGGKGEDIIKDNSSVGGFGKKTEIYDSKEGNKIFFGTEAADELSDDPAILDINRLGIRIDKIF